MTKRLITVSKFLSRHLRHEPEALGLTLEPGGWVFVDDLLAGAARAGFPITKDELAQVVAATKVGERRGRPVILVTDSTRMAADGFKFRLSDNGVWLADYVPPQYIRLV